MISLKDTLGAAISLTPLVVAALLFSSFEKHPTNDDWIYARSVVGVLEGPPTKWAAVNAQVLPAAVTPVLLGAAVCSWDGFSHGKLVGVTVVVTGIGVIGVYWLSRGAGAAVIPSIIAAWTFLFCPWIWRHVFTAMTDATALGFSAIATAAMVQGIRNDRAWLLGLGGVFLGAGVWTRQPTLALFCVPAIALVFQRRPLSERVIRLMLCAIPSTGALVSSELGWFGPSGADRASFIALWPPFGEWIKSLIYTGYGALLVIGFSLAPMAGQLAVGIRWNRSAKIAAIVGLLPFVFFVVRGGRAILTSATGPSLQNAHFGPILLGDCFEPGRWGDMGGIEWHPAVWFASTLIAFATLSIMAAASMDTVTAWWKSKDDRDLAVEFGLWCSGVGAGFVILFMMVFAFDRYWLAAVGPLMFWATMLIARKERSRQILTSPLVGKVAPEGRVRGHVGPTFTPPAAPRNADRPLPQGGRWLFAASGLALLIAFFVVDLIFTHDWLAFNATRWELVRRLQAEGFALNQIDGGYEVNGWIRSAEDPLTRPRPGGESARWWSEKGVRFLAIGPRPEMIEVDRAEWSSWAVRRQVPILVLRRLESVPSPP